MLCMPLETQSVSWWEVVGWIWIVVWELQFFLQPTGHSFWLQMFWPHWLVCLARWCWRWFLHVGWLGKDLHHGIVLQSVWCMSLIFRNVWLAFGLHWSAESFFVWTFVGCFPCALFQCCCIWNSDPPVLQLQGRGSQSWEVKLTVSFLDRPPWQISLGLENHLWWDTDTPFDDWLDRFRPDDATSNAKVDCSPSVLFVVGILLSSFESFGFFIVVKLFSLCWDLFSDQTSMLWSFSWKCCVCHQHVLSGDGFLFVSVIVVSPCNLFQTPEVMNLKHALAWMWSAFRCFSCWFGLRCTRNWGFCWIPRQVQCLGVKGSSLFQFVSWGHSVLLASLFLICLATCCRWLVGSFLLLVCSLSFWDLVLCLSASWQET